MLWQPSTEEIATWNRTLVRIEDLIFLLLGYIPESVLEEWNSGGTESGLEVGCSGGNSMEVEEIKSLISSLDELSILLVDDSDMDSSTILAKMEDLRETIVRSGIQA